MIEVILTLVVLGQGDPILLINGYGGNSTSWNPEFITELEKEHDVITINTNGSTIKEMAENTHNYIQNLGVKPHVLGYSMGGFIAQELALAHPESVDKLILTSTRCGGKNAVMPTEQVIAGFKSREVSKEMEIQYKAVERWNTTCDKLQDIKNPTLILIGADDEKTPLANSIFMDDKIPNSRLIELEGGHNLTNKFPLEVAGFVNAFTK